MNYLDQWTFFPDLASQEKKIQFYAYTLISPMTEGTVGPASTVYYSKPVLDTLKEEFRNSLFSEPGTYRYKYSFQNSLPKPSLPYYPLNV